MKWLCTGSAATPSYVKLKAAWPVGPLRFSEEEKTARDLVNGLSLLLTLSYPTQGGH